MVSLRLVFTVRLGLGLGIGNGYFILFFFYLKKVTNTFVLPSLRGPTKNGGKKD